MKYIKWRSYLNHSKTQRNIYTTGKAPCCKKYYTCRVCHDESESHPIDRNSVQKIKCLKCHLVQNVHKECEECHVIFGKYFCEICRLYDNEDKGQFHCDGCGLCRVGGRDHFFHCEKCDMCLSVKLKGNHKCVAESSRRNCAVCLEDLHTSRHDAQIPPCGHLIHRTCMEGCFTTGNYSCPTCNESLFDMTEAWKVLDEEIASTPMPEEYKNFHVSILCRDCHKESRALFHVIALKCQECGSYNTCRTAEHSNIVIVNGSTPIESGMASEIQTTIISRLEDTDVLQNGDMHVQSEQGEGDSARQIGTVPI